jgi:hypothetical protein
MKAHFKNNWYLYIIGFGIVIIIIKLLKDKNSPFKLMGSFSNDSGLQTSPVSFTNDNPDENLILKMGSQGNEVRALQSLMNAKLEEEKNSNGNWWENTFSFSTYFSEIEPDGNFGQLTENLLYYLIAENETTISEFNNIS